MQKACRNLELLVRMLQTQVLTVLVFQNPELLLQMHQNPVLMALMFQSPVLSVHLYHPASLQNFLKVLIP